MPALSSHPIADLPVTWLRDNCPCAQCRDPRSGQKLFQIDSLPDGLRVATVAVAETDGQPTVEVV
ncbi:gamma-butyrobetaine hydroxylase-like domain-containing protein [Streptomyces sp. NPDC046931]|uniref:gamma-butyrobetaine hydroxylase-like domain-containing protein n=1 Tax=Streptomyces sp. NPDC046931 TaxID=3154806 RepID=UPI0034084468